MIKKLCVLLICVLALAAGGCKKRTNTSFKVVTIKDEQGRSTLYTDNCKYVINEDGTAEFASYQAVNSKTFDIPAEVKGYTVTRIGNGACIYLTHLNEISIPATVTEVGINPFSGCTNLRTITVSPENTALETVNGVLFSKSDHRLVCFPTALSSTAYSVPEGTEVIGNESFYDCRTLTEISLPEGIKTIGDWAFSECYALRSVNIPAGVTAIGKRVFYGTALAEITLPGSIESMGEGVFANCADLRRVTIEEGVKSLGDRAFRKCDKLTEITIPASVTEIAVDPFPGCDSLKRITVAEGNPTLEIVDGVLFSKPDARLVCFPAASGITEYTVPEGTLIIGDSAFSNCRELTSVSIPASVTAIWEGAFAGCSSLNEITVPPTVTEFGNDAFGSARIIVQKGSAAEQYARENDVFFTYPQATLSARWQDEK